MENTKIQFVCAVAIVVALYYIAHAVRSMGGEHRDFAHVCAARDMRTIAPRTHAELRAFLRRNEGPVCVRGAGYSHGGQTLVEGGTQIDLRNLRSVRYDPGRRTVSVGAGCTWHDVLLALGAHGRTVAEMQSYYNFSVGGSISVNCHGRGMEHGSISDTVLALTVMTVDGEVRHASATSNSRLFRGVVGGYGLIAIVLEATLVTVANDRVKLEVSVAPSSRSLEVIERVASDPRTVFYNGNIYPGREQEIVSFAWVKCDDTDTVSNNTTVVQPKREFYWGHMLLEQLARRVPFIKVARAYLEPTIAAAGSDTNVAFLRSFAIAEDANKLRVLSKHPTTTVLQEYFVPVDRLHEFLEAFLPSLEAINLLNLSLRYVKRVTHSVLNYAPQDMVSLVLYLNVWNNVVALADLRRWTEANIDRAAALGGTYYLPYLLTYRPSQVRRMYPGWDSLMRLKRSYDPLGKLQNLMLAHINYRSEQTKFDVCVQ